jgi:hypothetical protein
MTREIFNNPCRPVDWHDEYDHASKMDYVNPVAIVCLTFGVAIGGSCLWAVVAQVVKRFF